MRDIEFLLNLYEQEYVKGERRSSESQRKIRYESWRKNRHLLFDELLLEIPIELNNNQIKVIRYMIDEFNDDFGALHRKSSDECIILAFMFYLIKIKTPGIRLTDYRICTKYGLTDAVFEVILCRLLLSFMGKCRIRPSSHGKDEHDILSREGKR